VHALRNLLEREPSVALPGDQLLDPGHDVLVAVQKAYADMGILGFAEADLDALAVRDEEIAQGFDRRRAEVERVAAVGAAA
jgi:hypothetical protein